MHGRIVAEIILHQGLRSGNLRSAIPRISEFGMKETPEQDKGRVYF